MNQQWSDAPIVTRDQDELGRASYAEHAARLIDEAHSWDDSIVFGLTGPWGSGKSSMVEMICESLEERGGNWSVARFTPWATATVDGLFGDFYASLISSLPPNRADQARKAFGRLLTVAAPAAKIIPIAGEAVTELVKSTADSLTAREPWVTSFQKAAAELKAIGTPILVVADDIDRLQTEELLALLKVVRLLGRFPGVSYLLAYDDATLVRTLSRTDLVGEGNAAAAANYMEKIVQYPLVVPPLLQVQLLDRLASGIEASLVAAGRGVDPSPRLSRLLGEFRSILQTPRAIDRYAAQLRHHLQLLPENEINDDDFLILTLLRTAFPSLYLQMPQYRSELTTGHTGEIRKGRSSGDEEGIFEDFEVDVLLEDVPVEMRNASRALLMELFPKLKDNRRSVPSSGERSICNDDYFDRYFAMSIPDHDVSDGRVADAVAAALQGRPMDLQTLVTADKVSVAELAIGKAVELSSSMMSSATPEIGDCIALAETLIPVIDQVSDRTTLLFGPRRRVVRWVSTLLQSCSEMEQQKVVELLRTSPDLYTQLWIMNEIRTPLPGWFQEAVDALAIEVRNAFLEHLVARDEAGCDDTYIMMIHFLMVNNVDRNQVKSEVASAISSGVIGIDDVASRFVYADAFERYGFNQDGFNALVPGDEHEWYEAEPGDVVAADSYWMQRKAYARGRARRPSD